jgi:hypothetical protein
MAISQAMIEMKAIDLFKKRFDKEDMNLPLKLKTICKGTLNEICFCKSCKSFSEVHL